MTRAATVPSALDGPLPSLVVEDRCAPTILDRIVREFEPYLERAANHIAADDLAIVKDLVQEARITLWNIDLGRFAQHDAAYLKRMLCSRMIQAYSSECRRGLTTGWSQHAVSVALLEELADTG
jgi:DNA-directed RNA polymerase specialized sigma24 family protein